MSRQVQPSPDPGSGDQNYLASVSDVMAALIFVFIIVLVLFAYQLSNVTEEQANITERLVASDETRSHILRELKERLEESGMSVEVLHEQGVLRLSDNAINFPSGSESPVKEHQFNVGRLARALAEVMPCYVSSDREDAIAGSSTEHNEPSTENIPGYCRADTATSTYPCEEKDYPWLLETLLIEGHTDSVPVGSERRFRDNLELSSMRAATVYRMIVACEPRIEQMHNTENVPVLSTSGYGYTRPVTLDPERNEYNRRIDLRLLLEPPEEILPTAESNFLNLIEERMGGTVQ